MNILPIKDQTTVIAALVDGCSIRTVERLTGVNRNTIMRLGTKVGIGCGIAHDILMRNIQVSRLELDEIWNFVGKKRTTHSDAVSDGNIGEQYTFIGMDGVGKAIISYYTGKRNMPTTMVFMEDLSSRVIGAPEISTDGWSTYRPAIQRYFGETATHGVVDKEVVFIVREPSRKGAKTRVLGKRAEIKKFASLGEIDYISTNTVERQNLDFRMNQKRFARKSNGFSKKLENHCAAVSLYVFHHNFCRIHGAIKKTPAMHLGLASRPWSISDMINAALHGEVCGSQITPIEVIQPNPLRLSHAPERDILSLNRIAVWPPRAVETV